MCFLYTILAFLTVFWYCGDAKISFEVILEVIVIKIRGYPVPPVPVWYRLK